MVKKLRHCQHMYNSPCSRCHSAHGIFVVRERTVGKRQTPENLKVKFTWRRTKIQPPFQKSVSSAVLPQLTSTTVLAALAADPPACQPQAR